MYQKCVQSKVKENNQYFKLFFIRKFSKFIGNELQNKEEIHNITNGTNGIIALYLKCIKKVYKWD